MSLLAFLTGGLGASGGSAAPVDLIAMIRGKVRDSSSDLQTGDYEQALNEATARYSKDRPRILVGDIAGTGGHDYDLPTGWVDGISTITSVEYPTGRIPEEILDAADWRLYLTPDGRKIRFLSAPALGYSARLLYTAAYDAADIPTHDRDAVANLAASICCRMLAARYGQTSDPLIGADVVNYRSKTDEFRRLADSYEAQYRTHLGLEEGDTTPAASATVKAPPPRRTRMTH